MTTFTLVETPPRKRYKASKRPVARFKPRKPTKTLKRKKITRTKLIKKADIAWSQYIRNKYAENGAVKCFTCDFVGPVGKLQNGHWIVRQYKYVRWDEDNLRPQCYVCNFRFNGRPHLFRENLVEDIGEERVKSLEVRAKVLFTEADDWIIEKEKEALSKLSKLSAN